MARWDYPGGPFAVMGGLEACLMWRCVRAPLPAKRPYARVSLAFNIVFSDISK